MKKTRRSMLNIITSIVPSFVIIVIGFLKFKYFINVYGDDLNGVVQLITQIYAYLSLAELGFGAATPCSQLHPDLSKAHRQVSLRSLTAFFFDRFAMERR